MRVDESGIHARSFYRILGWILFIWACLAISDLALRNWPGPEIPYSLKICDVIYPLNIVFYRANLNGIANFGMWPNIEMIACFCMLIALSWLTPSIARRLHLGPTFSFFICFIIMISGGLMSALQLKGSGISFLDAWRLMAEMSVNRNMYIIDALNISDVPAWLRSFNTIQPTLRIHSIGHPPFTILIYYYLYHGLLDSLAMTFLAVSAVSSFSIFFLWKILALLNVNQEKITALCIFFSMIPGVNIYASSGIDGVNITLNAMFIYGLLRAAVGKLDIPALLCMAFGLFFCAAINYLWLFLVATTLFFLLFLWATHRNTREVLRITLAGAALIFLIALAIWAMNIYWGFNYLSAFRTACHYASKGGFLLLVNPHDYFWTRTMSIFAVFTGFSFVGTAMAFASMPSIAYIKKQSTHLSFAGLGDILFLSGSMALLAMFAAGAWAFAETDRSCQFFYLFFLLPLIKVSSRNMAILLRGAGIQTAFMLFFIEFSF